MFHISPSHKDPVNAIVTALVNGHIGPYTNIRQYEDGSYLIGEVNHLGFVKSNYDYVDFGSVYALLELILQE